MAVDLLKKNQESVRKILLEKNLVNFKCDVNFICDTSGSTHSDFSDGSMQYMLTKLFSIASIVDVDNAMRMYTLSDTTREIGKVTMTNYNTYISDKIIKKGLHGGGTIYSKAMKKCFSDNCSSNELIINFVLTDGQNCISDNKNVKDIIKESNDYKMFWIFIGFRNSNFLELKELKSQNKNVDFFKVSDLKSKEVTNSHSFYNTVFRKIPDYKNTIIKKPKLSFIDRIKNIIKTLVK